VKSIKNQVNQSSEGEQETCTLKLQGVESQAQVTIKENSENYFKLKIGDKLELKIINEQTKIEEF
jgi:hypothetical protein